MYNTRKEFLLEVQRRAGLDSLKEADRISRIIIGLIKARIPAHVSELIAQSVPRGLAKGWTMIALPEEAIELQDLMSELEEEPPVPQSYFPEFAPEYG